MESYDVEEVLAKASLPEVARHLGMELERRGVNYRALCPFHSDTRPSLNLFPASDSGLAHYHCFACGAHGSAIDLVKQVQGVDFIPAVQWLGKTIGLSPFRRGSERRGSVGVVAEDALTFAERVFRERHDVARFRVWCEQRHFDPAYLFGAGLRCVSGNVLVAGLEARSAGERAALTDGLLEVGLLVRLRPKAGDAHEQFKLTLPEQFRDYFHDGRVLIPIYKLQGKASQLVGYAGRSLDAAPPDGAPKYLLNPGLPKAELLFNAPEAFRAIDDEVNGAPGRSSALYLVEGFFDALRLRSLGQPAVALMGTSLGKGQRDLLEGLVNKLPPGAGDFEVRVLLDGDKAGFSGTDRLVRNLLGWRGVRMRWVAIEGIGKDPDSWLQGESPATGKAVLDRSTLPAVAALLATELGATDAAPLRDEKWCQLALSTRERALFRVVKSLRELARNGETPQALDMWLRAHLADEAGAWAADLLEFVSQTNANKVSRPGSTLFLQGFQERLRQARVLAYHGSRRNELPCDEETWLSLDLGAKLFDQVAAERLRQDHWSAAAPFDAVYLPRKLTADAKVLDDPRRKVMPHPADLHLQQVILNELLTERHDQFTFGGQVFSDCIPAVRWDASNQSTEVTGLTADLAARPGEEPALSFGYQVDMAVLEGRQSPTDQGMFRPFGACWRSYMESVARQCEAIGPRVFVLRLDAQRYYDKIQRYVVRDALKAPIDKALIHSGPEVFRSLLGCDENVDLAERVVDWLCDAIFHHDYQDPGTGARKRSEEACGIPQGPVLSAYVGTIALFPVDGAARLQMRKYNPAEPVENARARVGYARYVDDLMLLADSEEVLNDLRQALQAAAAPLGLTLLAKGSRIAPGTPKEVMQQLNEGRNLAGSVPTWEPPFVADGEAGFGLGGDLPQMERQCALRLLRHPGMLEETERIQDKVRQAMQAPDLRSADLALCARWLWWQVANELTEDAREPARVWTRYGELWRYVSEGHAWAAEFERRGYHWLYAVEGLDKLLDPNPWMESGQSSADLQAHRVRRYALARIVGGRDDFFAEIKPLENDHHIQRRTRLVKRKAHRLLEPQLRGLLPQPQGTAPVTNLAWLCMAADLLRNVSATGAGHPLDSLADRPVHDPRAVAAARNARRDLYPSGDSDKTTNPEALDLVVRNSPPAARWKTLQHFPNLLGANQEITLLEPLPLQKALWGFAPTSGPLKLSRFSGEQDPVTIELPGARITVQMAAGMQLHTALFRGDSVDAFPWRRVTPSGLPTHNRTNLAATLFKALLRMRTASVADEAFVPLRAHLFSTERAAEADPANWVLVAEPVAANELGVSAWYSDSLGHLRTVNVPLAGAEYWRIGWAVADVLGWAEDLAVEGGERDEVLSDSARHPIEDYVLRQQLRKLQGQHLSEAQTLSVDESGVPRTIARALTLLKDFDGSATVDAQVRQLLVIEAETRAMALRLKQRGIQGLRQHLQEVPLRMLERLPLWVVEGLPLRASPGLRPDFALLLALTQAMTPAETQQAAALESLLKALALAAATAALRGSVATLRGLRMANGPQLMPERLPIPPQWPVPDAERHDPQADYAAIRSWLSGDDWPALSRARPWHWMLAMLGLLNEHRPQTFEIEALQKVYRCLEAWEQAAAEEEAVWPYDDLPPLDCGALLEALPIAVRELDDALGVRVLEVSAHSYRRDPHSDAFTDSSGAEWLLQKASYTGLGAEGRVAKRQDGSRMLRVWTEVRSRSGQELLSVHTLDDKLGRWLSPAVQVSLPAPPAEAERESQSPAATRAEDPPQPESEGGGGEAGHGAANAEFRNLQVASWTQRGETKFTGHMRVALFQWRIDETYSHPLCEVGLAGLGLPAFANDAVVQQLKVGSTLSNAAEAAKPGHEWKWNESRRVPSWPEHRRRRLLREVLEACRALKVDLLVLPEVSVRPETIQFLSEQLVRHGGPAVLAGTYRQFDSQDSPNHLREPLTLLWRPEQDVLDALRVPAGTVFSFERSKKYRAVAAKEFFRPQWKTLAPLFSPESLLGKIVSEPRQPPLAPSDMTSILGALTEKLPPLRYGMELVCSELFLMTSPANLPPLRQEVAALLKRFPESGGDARKIVHDDYEALGEHLTVAQSVSRPRRSVLLVPAATTRSNDYWYAGQASVLASGTATVFCNAVIPKVFNGGSCFIASEAVSWDKASAGVVGALTPYHGWRKGVFMGRASDALSETDQALVVVDLDPVHVVSGKPRPQLLAEPMSMVAYLPVVEVEGREETAQGLAQALKDELSAPEGEALRKLLAAREDRSPDRFQSSLNTLLDLKAKKPRTTLDSAELKAFAKQFGDPAAVRDRLLAWERDRHQQPNARFGPDQLEAAWLDFLVVDQTLKDGEPLVHINVPTWSADAAGHASDLAPPA